MHRLEARLGPPAPVGAATRVRGHRRGLVRGSWPRGQGCAQVLDAPHEAARLRRLRPARLSPRTDEACSFGVSGREVYQLGRRSGVTPPPSQRSRVVGEGWAQTLPRRRRRGPLPTTALPAQRAPRGAPTSSLILEMRQIMPWMYEIGPQLRWAGRTSSSVRASGESGDGFRRSSNSGGCRGALDCLVLCSSDWGVGSFVVPYLQCADRVSTEHRRFQLRPAPEACCIRGRVSANRAVHCA